MTAHKTLLIVDGDPDARSHIIESLAPGPWNSVEAGSAEAALEIAQERHPDLVILDRYLPDISGLGLCRLLRESPGLARTPILMVSAQGDEIDRILAFEAGADDFLPKPFFPPELAARARAILRGYEASSPPPGGGTTSRTIRIDSERSQVEVEGRRVDFTPTELQILATLVSQDGKVVRRRDLIRGLRGPDVMLSDRAVDAHVKGIRRKLGSARGCIETVRGVGYRFTDPG